ncbi:hypothetical protein FACS1894109_15610 [Spirochaetia bacterium]|nr:hypothetical protein FACS1894109_15610 [Spirochaetia bacterium]
MIRTNRGLVPGPYSPGEEARFKADAIKAIEAGWRRPTCFKIETEETEPGFPDVLMLANKTYDMYEFKVSDSKGIIKFQKTQPLFYKRHSDLNIEILAWDVPNNRAVNISPDEIVAAKALKFQIPKETNEKQVQPEVAGTGESKVGGTEAGTAGNDSETNALSGVRQAFPLGGVDLPPQRLS